MRAAAPRVTRVLTAELAGSGRSQDRVVVLPHAVIVLDGASDPLMRGRDGGWYAGTLGDALARGLRDEPGGDLQAMLREAIADVAGAHGLVPGAAPSSTVAVLRWHGDVAEALLLGDSAIVAFLVDGRFEELADGRLAGVASAQRRAHRRRLRGGHGFDGRHQVLLRDLVAEQRRWRNREGGYWIAEATPGAGGGRLPAAGARQ